MTELKGNKNVKEAIVAVAAIFNAIVESKKDDGKIDMKDAFRLMGLFPKVVPAIEDGGEIMPEFKDLSAEEIADISAALVAELGSVDEKVKLMIEKDLLAIKAIYEAIKAHAA
jgi:hypothetical protein